jgi:hypothetical protein
MTILSDKSMRFLLVSAVVFSTLAGCTSMRIVGPHSPESPGDSLDYAEVQQRIERRTVRVTLRDGHVHSAVDVQVASDSVRFAGQLDGIARTVPTIDVLLIEKSDHFLGGIGGFLSGAFGGGFLGWAYGSATAHGEMRGLTVGLSMIDGVFVGAICGGLIGGIHGVATIYDFGQQSREHRDANESNSGTP